MHLRLLSLGLAVAAPFASAAEPGIVAASGPRRVPLLELFTSEGCSSCPPAEAWMRTLRGNAGLWRDFVPVVFHVDYWNKLGWPDRFSSAESTARQRAYSDVWGTSSVYTPGFVLNGAEWRRTLPAGGDAGEVGRLTLTRADGGGRRFTVRWEPAGGAAGGAWNAQVALLGADLETKVRRGENAGATLRHDFVVLTLGNGALRETSRGTWTGEVTLPAASAGVANDVPRAAAAWIFRGGDRIPQQAAGGWLGEPK